MPKFTEETLNGWRKPPSDTEETKLANSYKLVKEAIAEDSVLSKKNIEVFAQGSYANDTNVRLNSDIDINVRLSDTVYYDVPTGKTKEDYGYTDSAYTFEQYKNDVYNALIRKFGAGNITRNDKCLTVKENYARVVTDVVPTFKFNRHEESGATSVGTKFITDEGYPVVSFPLQHIANGKQKNSTTQKRFKRTTRLFRRIRYKMIDDGLVVSKNITSFLLECLVYNMPDHIFNNNNTWTEILRNAIIYLYEKAGETNECAKWGEVSELLYLFHAARKWNRTDVNSYLVQMWNYLEY